MFPFRTHRRKADGLTALGFSGEGVGVARVLRRDGVPPVLDLCEYRPLEAGRTRARVLEELARAHALDTTPCSIVVDPGVYSLLLLEAPEVPPEEMRAAVRWRIQDLIDFHIDDAVVDVFDVPRSQGAGRPQMMYVVAARVPQVRESTELVQDADLDLAVVDVPELAQRNIAAQLPEDASGVALLYLSTRSGLITLTRQATLYLARRIETGLGALQLSPAFGGGEAESSTDTHGWLDALAVEVQRSLDYYESNFSQPPIVNLVIAPLEKPIPGMVEYLASQLGINVRALDLHSVVDCHRPLDTALQARCFSLIGGALRAEERTL